MLYHECDLSNQGLVTKLENNFCNACTIGRNSYRNMCKNLPLSKSFEMVRFRFLRKFISSEDLRLLLESFIFVWTVYRTCSTLSAKYREKNRCAKCKSQIAINKIEDNYSNKMRTDVSDRMNLNEILLCRFIQTQTWTKQRSTLNTRMSERKENVNNRKRQPV